MSYLDKQTAEQRIKELEQQLEQMRLKAEFFEAVVEELKKDYGISILKKRATQSCESSCCGSSQG
ncbi:hypothetical protein EF849_08310 [Aeromonas jandaei]|nr:hypothetical protein [Aeromonas jandaei]